MNETDARTVARVLHGEPFEHESGYWGVRFDGRFGNHVILWGGGVEKHYATRPPHSDQPDHDVILFRS